MNDDRGLIFVIGLILGSFISAVICVNMTSYMTNSAWKEELIMHNLGKYVPDNNGQPKFGYVELGYIEK